MSKFKYFIKKTVITAFLIYLVGTALFFMFKAMPGSFLDVVAASGAGPEKIAALKAKWGLDDPVYIQYIRYLTNMLTGDVGNSFKYGLPVTTLVGRRIVNSFILVGPAITFAYIVSSVYGLMMGNNRGSFLDKYGVFPVTILGTIPEFFIGILLIIVFSGVLGILPSSGMLSLEAQTQLGQNSPFWAAYTTQSFWIHYILPFMTIVLRYMYLPSLIMRTSVVEVSGQDFMYYHRLKGLTNTTQLRHLMKHASLPVITVFPASMTRSIGGMVLVEVVFNWPGIGKLLIDSVLFRDTPVVQFVFFLVAVWVILGNYVVDLLYSVIDPRITVEGA
jgi:peptide/nickel transport system permease protein